MPCAGIPTVRVGHVKVKDALVAGTDAVFYDWIFDVYVKGVQEQAQVVGFRDGSEIG